MNTPEPDIHFGTTEQMLAWCAREGIAPLKDASGRWDWQATYDAWQPTQPDDEDDE